MIFGCVQQEGIVVIHCSNPDLNNQSNDQRVTDTLRDVGPDGCDMSQMEVTVLASSINMMLHAHVSIRMSSLVSDRNTTFDW